MSCEQYKSYYLKYCKSSYCNLRVIDEFSLCVFIDKQFSNSNYRCQQILKVWKYLVLGSEIIFFFSVAMWTIRHVIMTYFLN